MIESNINAGEVSQTHAKDLRVILWDIDGTLVRSSRMGAFKLYTAPVLEKVFGTSGRLNEMAVSGMTDWQIVIEALRDEGFTHAKIRERAQDLRTIYMQEMERVAAESEDLFYALPGAKEILQTTEKHPRYLNSLLTGNIKPAAKLKLRFVGLADFFSLPGAFGDDSHDRRELPAIASARINRRLNLALQPAQFIVIGDTPNDIRCARFFGAHVIAVATGRSYSADDLLKHKPDAVLPDLTDAALVLQTIHEL